MKIFNKNIGVIGVSVIFGAVILAVLAGVYFYEIQLMAPIPVKSIQHLTSASSTATSGRKTYYNYTYGFSIKYPDAWNIVVEPLDGTDVDKTILNGHIYDPSKPGGPDYPVLRFYIYRSDTTSLSDWFKEVIGTEGQDSNIIINGMNGIRSEDFSMSNVPNIIEAFAKNGRIFVFSSEGRANIDTMNTILSTFENIDITDTSMWQTYRNDKYGFEFMHPQKAIPNPFSGEDATFAEGIRLQWAIPTAGAGPLDVDGMVIAPFKFLYTTNDYLINFLENRDYVAMRDAEYPKYQLVQKINDASHTIFEVQTTQNLSVSVYSHEYVALNKKTKQLYFIESYNYPYGYNADTERDAVRKILSTFKFL